jgi:site-specific recombinase XerD
MTVDDRIIYFVHKLAIRHTQVINMNIEDNKAVIKDFEQSLKSEGLAKKTIKRHLQNVDLFVIDYMDVEEIEFEDWPDEIDEFFDWAIRKNVIISQSSLKQFISSVKKFFQFLFNSGKIDSETSKKVNQEFIEGKEYWEVCVQRFEDDIDEW